MFTPMPGDPQIAGEFVPGQRRHLRMSGHIGSAASGADGDRFRFLAIAPQQTRADTPHEGTVEHPDFTVGSHIHQSKYSLQQCRPRLPLLGEDRKLVILHPPAVGADPVNQNCVQRACSA